MRLLIAASDGVRHTRFRDLAQHLSAGDLVVVNTSATLPAAIDATRPDGQRIAVHTAGPAPDDAATWLVELRRPDGHGPVTDGHIGEALALIGGGTLRLIAPHPEPDAATSDRLWRAAVTDTDLTSDLARHGRPISYGYLADRWPLRHYQPVFAREPGSAEMASAGRPFTERLVTELMVHGVTLAPIELHAGVSSLEADEDPPPERFRVPPATARLVEHARRHGGRIVAVGTTVTRALESALDPHGTVRPRQGWTDLVLGPDRPAEVVTGLVTGWHAPDASHLRLLDAVAGRDLVDQAYDAALADAYRWHEFGDTCLLLPPMGTGPAVA